MKDKDLISYHSRMDRPVPGEGLLTDPENPMPWERPTRFSSVIEASEFIFSEITNEDLYPVILDEWKIKYLLWILFVLHCLKVLQMDYGLLI